LLEILEFQTILTSPVVKKLDEDVPYVLGIWKDLEQQVCGL
jgi:hypothetical protein